MRKESLEYLKKALDVIERVFTFLAMISVFMMICLTTADSLGRYFLNHPIRGAFEFIENYLMILAIYLALAHSYKNGANVRITFLISRIPPQVTLVINHFVQAFSILYIIFLFISATRINFSRLNNVVPLTQTLNIPVWPAYLVISVGLLFVTIFAFLDLWQVRKGKSGLFKEASDDSAGM